MKYGRYLLYLLPMLFTLFLLGCSSGSDDGTKPVAKTGTGLSGTAAAGKSLANVTVALKGANGKRLTETADSTGHYAFIDLDKKGVTAPYLLKVDSEGGKRLYSIAHVLANSANTANIHPLSDVVARSWYHARNRNIDAEFDDNNPIANLPAKTDIDAIVIALTRLLEEAYVDFTIDSNFNFLGSSFSANGEGFAKLLDAIEVVINNTSVTIRLTDPISGSVAII
ncbi:MAG: hypothetical protein ACC707_18295, partial [Thiohalomonadales bacterium]